MEKAGVKPVADADREAVGDEEPEAVRLPEAVPEPLAVLFTKPGGDGPSGSCHGQLPPSGGRNVGMSE